MNNSFICPNCGTEVRVGSASCTGCGSDDNTGWSDDAIYDGIDLPESYEEHSKFQDKKKNSHLFSVFVGILLFKLFIYFRLLVLVSDVVKSS